MRAPCGSIVAACDVKVVGQCRSASLGPGHARPQGEAEGGPDDFRTHTLVALLVFSLQVVGSWTLCSSFRRSSCPDDSPRANFSELRHHEAPESTLPSCLAQWHRRLGAFCNLLYSLSLPDFFCFPTAGSPQVLAAAVYRRNTLEILRL